MTAACRSAPQRAGVAAVWLSALLLLALVALAGLPDSSAATATPQRIERCDGVGAAAAFAADDDVVAVRVAVRAEARAPRPRPRTRDGQRRGLPPCRAPTC